MQSQGKTGHRFLWQGKQLAHGSSKAEDCDLIQCLSHLQINSFPGICQKKKSWAMLLGNNTSQNKALTMEIDCLETLWGQEKIKAFLKEWLKIFIAILWWWLFSADMGHSCTCLCEERKTRMKGFFYIITIWSHPIAEYTECGFAKEVFFWILMAWSQG